MLLRARREPCIHRAAGVANAATYPRFHAHFFVMVGVSLNLRLIDWNLAFVWQLSIALLVVAVASKWLAGYAIRESQLRQTAIGLSMIPRGEVGLIFAQLGLSTRILDAELFAALPLVIALMTLLPPFVPKAFYAHYGSRRDLAE